MAQQSKKIKVFDGRYEILTVVGRGECSVVYKVKLIAPPRKDAALKVLVNRDGGGSNIDKLRKEALAMVSSKHRYVIRLDDFHSFNDICYLCMEYAPHNSMRLYSEKIGGKLPIEQAETFLTQMLEALSFVHEVGIVHRDIKPDNILIVSEDEARLADFGIAVLPGEESSLEELQKGVGTMDYMAPEVFQAKSCSTRSDIYCMGVTFYEMLSGIQPFNGAPLARLLDIRRDKNIIPISKLVPDIPAYLSEVIMRAMSFDEKNRYESGTEMLQELRNAKLTYSNELADPVIPIPQEEDSPEYPEEEEIEAQNYASPEQGYDSFDEENEEEDTFNEYENDSFDDDDNNESNTFDDSTEDSIDDDEEIFGPSEKTIDLHNAANYQQPFSTKKNDYPDDFENDETVVISPEELQESLGSNSDEFSDTTYHEDEVIDENATIPISQPTMFNSDHQTLGPSSAKAWEEAHNAVNEYEEDGTLMVEDLPKKEDEDPRIGIEEHGFDFIDASLSEDDQVHAPELHDESEPDSTPAPIDVQGSNKHLPQLLTIFALLFVIWLAFFSGIFGSSPEEEFVEPQIAALRPEVPQFESDSSEPLKPAEVREQIKGIRFPNLPAGIYSGQINNFFPGISVPLSFVSLPAEESIVVIIGIDGWRTTKVHIDPNKPFKSFKVRANGMVLVFVPANEDGLRGTFENQITHDKGSWEAFPTNVRR